MSLGGRDLNALSAELAAHASEGAALTLGVFGAEGMGKTYLLRHLAVRAAAAGVRVVATRGYGERASLLAIRQLGEQLGLEGAPEVSDATSATFWLRRHLSSSRLRDQRLALFFDDLHAAHADDLVVLQNLVLSPPSRGLITVVTLTPGVSAEADQFLAHLRDAPGRVTTVTLSPLDTHSLVQLAGEALGVEPDITFVERLREYTGGVPLYVRELLRVIGALPPDERDQVFIGIRPLDHLDFSELTEESIRTRLSRLDADDVSVLQALAFKRGASRPEIEHLSGIPTDRTQAALQTLSSRRLVNARPLESDGALTFEISEGIVARCVAAAIPLFESQQLRREITDLLESLGPRLSDARLVELAEHYLAGVVLLDAARIQRVLAAARFLNSQSRYIEARDVLRRLLRALPVSASDETKAEARELLAQALSHLGAAEEAEQLLAEYAAPGKGELDPEVRARLLWRLARLQLAARRDREAILTYEAILGSAASLPLPFLNRVRSSLAEVYRSNGQSELAVETARAAADDAKAAGDFRTAASVRRIVASTLLTNGLAEESLAVHREALAEAAAAHDPRSHARILSSTGLARGDLGSVIGGARIMLRGLRHSRELGDFASASVTARVLAVIYLEAGLWDEAAKVTALSASMDRNLHRGRSLAHTLATSQLVEAARGHWDDLPDALPPLDESLSDIESIAPLAGALFERELALRRPDAALRIVNQIDSAVRRRTGHERLRFRQVLPRKALALADLGRARELDLLLAEFVGFNERTRGTQPLIQAEILLTRGLRDVIANNYDSGIVLLEAAVTALERSGYRWRATRARHRLGLAYAAAGQGDSAAREMTLAFRLLSEMGSAPAVDRVRSDLRSMRRRPPVAQRDTDVLTAREWDVVRAALRGRTDAEIAQDLWVSRRTVTTHMHNVLRKLELKSRTQLETWVKEHAEPAFDQGV